MGTGIEALIIKAIITAVVSYAIGAIATALVGGPSAGKSAVAGNKGAPPDLIDALQTAVDPSGPLPGVFGSRRVGGRLVFNGKSGQDTFIIILIAGAPVRRIDTVYINNKAVTLDGSGNVTDAPWYNAAKKAYSINIKLYDGTQTTTDSLMDAAFADWTANTIGKNIAYARIRIRPEPRDAFQEAFQTGVPDFTFHVYGHECYDPRSRAFRESIDNPAIIAANYIIHPLGMNEPRTRVDWAAVARDADICDQLVPIISGDLEPRYRCSAVFWTDMRHEDVLSEIGATMAGGVALVGDKYETWCGNYSAPQASYSETHMAEDGIEVSYANPIEQAINGVRGTFTSPLDNWEERDFPAYQNGVAISEDGREIWGDVKYSFVTSPSQAQRLAKIQFMFARYGTQASMHAKLDCLNTTIGDIISVSEPLSNLSNQTFRVYAEEFDGETFTIRYRMTKEEARFYEFNAATEEQPYSGFSDDPSFVDELVPPAFYVEDVPIEATNVARAIPGASKNTGVDLYQVEYKRITDTVWTSLGSSPESTKAAVMTPSLGATGTQYNFRMRTIRNATGSDWRELVFSAGGARVTVT